VNKINVLIVDDEPTARQTLLAHLNRPGFQALTACNATEAFEALAEHDVDVILLDVMMPDMDGFELCRRIKANPDWDAIPVLMATALDSQQDRNDGLAAGADDFLTKPVNPTELRLRLTAHSKARAYHRLLENVLPTNVARRLRDQPGFVADHVENATILFSDLVGFVPFTMSRSPSEIVGLLNEIFSLFDARCAERQLEKIKTIGDAYMLAGGLLVDEDPADAAIRVVEAGLDFFNVVAEMNKKHDLQLQLRVGVNTGPTIAGVIGKTRLAYDLWGNAVNLASRMESQGLPGHIQLSPSTRAMVGDRFALEARGAQEIKGRGLIETWLLPGL
jgi:class 3 adenylate cyclase